MTARECAPWLARPDFLELSVADRVRYVRRNLRGRAQDGGMTQPELAAAVGIRDSRHHTIINWEKGKSEPKRYKKSLSDLTPYEPDDFVVQRGAAGVSLESLDARLRSLEGQVGQAVVLMEEALQLLRASPQRVAPAVRVRRKAG